MCNNPTFTAPKEPDYKDQTSTCYVSMSGTNVTERYRKKPFEAKVKQSSQVTAWTKKRIQYAQQNSDFCYSLYTLTKTQLRSRYPSEYRAWERARNPDRRQKGIEFDHSLFSDPRDFMFHLGPRPSPSYSVDRIDFYGPYRPGNLRWATKQEQAQNRRTTRRICWAGNSYTRQEFAAFLGIPYKRLSRQIKDLEWPLTRIVQEAGKEIDPVDSYVFPESARSNLERRYNQRTMDSDDYYIYNRLDWLPHFYKSQRDAETRSKQRSELNSLYESAERERKERYAKRALIAEQSRDELISSLVTATTSTSHMPAPVAGEPAQGTELPPATDCNTQHDSRNQEGLTEDEESPANRERFNKFMRFRIAQLRNDRALDWFQAGSLAIEEYRQLQESQKQQMFGSSTSHTLL